MPESEELSSKRSGRTLCKTRIRILVSKPCRVKRVLLTKRRAYCLLFTARDNFERVPQGKSHWWINAFLSLLRMCSTNATNWVRWTLSAWKERKYSMSSSLSEPKKESSRYIYFDQRKSRSLVCQRLIVWKDWGVENLKSIFTLLVSMLCTGLKASKKIFP